MKSLQIGEKNEGRKGLDKKSFAFYCEIGRTQLHMIENGKTNPCLSTLLKIATALEISVSELVEG
ncbi:helix-turn-helix domain-containing protein [Sphingobacterium corticibacter]|uniref:HTH cro/C1-type domain-containing protein n=1 Tax=Sphingobacterium corticibacter TaxID=2171749 RepID=A0A2T8HJF0_9SPHI|nr:hypothetical protein DC487_06000 [Sphingobacterium corticibacter]